MTGWHIANTVTLLLNIVTRTTGIAITVWSVGWGVLHAGLIYQL